MGMISIAADSEIKLSGIVSTDSTVALGIVHREGLDGDGDVDLGLLGEGGRGFSNHSSSPQGVH